MKVLIVVDMQNDFIDGSLGTQEAKNIVHSVCEKIRNFDGKIYVTLDTHQDNYLDTFEGKNLPVEHCIKGTNGWLINQSVRNALRGKDYSFIEKPTFGTTQLGSSIQMLSIENKGDFEIEMIGLCTDICVISNALMLRAKFPEVKITVDASCCAGVTPESHEASLMTMRMCQIQVINEQEV